MSATAVGLLCDEGGGREILLPPSIASYRFCHSL